MTLFRYLHLVRAISPTNYLLRISVLPGQLAEQWLRLPAAGDIWLILS